MFGMVSIILALQQGSSAANNTIDYANSISVELFQEYIKINTITNNDLTDAVEYWKALASVADVPISVHEYVEGYPVVVLKWAGTDSSLDSIMLNSHMDVVSAAKEDGWTYDPFSGSIDDNGDIYGRGTQDMKSVSIQHYEALRRLKNNNITLLRDVYMTLMPDEEVGSKSGMIPFLGSDEFAAMNVGIEIDEGVASPLSVIEVIYQEKVAWQIQVDCYGISGHGSTFPETNTTATGKCNNVINKFFAFRDEQYEIFKTAPPNDASRYTSVNLNKLSGGTANNVIPRHVSLSFDMRLGFNVDKEKFNATLYKWIAEAGDNITLSYTLKSQQDPATVANSSNPYWRAISCAADNLGITIVPSVPTGSSDARLLRNAGYPTIGFSPMPNTPRLAHSVDEYVNVNIFKRGIDIYAEVIRNLANIPGTCTADDPSAYLYMDAL